MSSIPGPKETALRAMREDKASRVKKPSKADLRKTIEKIKPVTKPRKRGR